MQVRYLGWEDPLEEGMATHSRILAWRIPWRRSLMGYNLQGHTEQDTTKATQHAGIMMIVAALFCLYLMHQKKMFSEGKITEYGEIYTFKTLVKMQCGREMWVTKAMRERGYETIARTETRVVSGETLEGGRQREAD